MPNGQNNGSAQQATEDAPGMDTLSAVLRGPESVVLYWSLEGARSARIVERIGPDVRWVLRVLDLQNGTSERLTVDREAGNYYVAVKPGGTYGFELAAVSGDKWRTVARTGRVHIPPRSETRTSATGARAAGARGPASKDAAVRGLDVPGLHAESTPLNTGASEFVGTDEDE